VSQKFTTALLLSFGLHFIILGVLFFGEFSSTPKATPMPVAEKIKPIQATVVDASKLKREVDKLKKKKADARAAENNRLKALEKRAAQAKKKRAKEEARIKKLERQRKKKEQEKRAADKAAKKSKAKAAQADKVRKQKEQEKQKAEDAAAAARSKRLKEEAAAKKADDLRKKKIAERKRKEKEAKERAERERLLEQQMAEEMAERQTARRQQRMSEINRFSALITQTINRNMIKDRSTMEGKSCKLSISLAPSGFVTNVQIGRGDRIVCEAAKTAIYKAGTLPVSKDPEVFKEMRNLAVTVEPDF